MKNKKSLLSVRGLKKFLSTYRATGNLRISYLLNMQRQRQVSLKIAGRRGTFRIRTGTSDAIFLREAVCNGFEFTEYSLPVSICPRTICDIGANTGIVTHCLVNQYPNARVFAFEPLAENYALLEHNVRHLDNVKPLHYGLGKKTGCMKYFASDDPTNLGGGSFYPTESQADLAIGELPIMSPADAIAKFDICDIDLIKIDTEGAEYDILTSFPTEVISNTTAIVGELHQCKDAETIEFLSQWFEVQHTPTKGRLSLFKAINKQYHHSVRPPVADFAASAV